MGIVDYNDVALLALAQHRGIDLTDPYWNLVSHSAAPIVDRTGTLPAPLDIAITHPMPGPGRAVNFHDLMAARAAELVARGKPIIVYWSGGIDSTAALVALLKAGVKDVGLTVRMSRFSPSEFTSFFDAHLRSQDGLAIEWIGACAHLSLTREDLQTHTVVTGELGDQLFGSVCYRYYTPAGTRILPAIDDCDCDHLWIDGLVPKGTWLLFLEPWEKAFMAPFMPGERPSTGYLENHRSAEAVVDYLRPLMAKCPFEVRNAFDAWWWINFTCKWQPNVYRFVSISIRPAAK